MENRKFIRRTRDNRYYLLPDGVTIVAEPNDLWATDYSFVVKRPIEYKKKRAPKKVPPKRAEVNALRRKITAKTRILRATINRNAIRATHVYSPINLELTVVPKPKRIKNQKQLKRIFFNGGLPVKDEKEEEKRREAKRQASVSAVHSNEPIAVVDSSSEDEEFEEVAQHPRIISSTMVNRSSSSSLFNDISNLSSSCVPTISSGTMQLLAPIIEMALAEDEFVHLARAKTVSTSTESDADTTPSNAVGLVPIQPKAPKKIETNESLSVMSQAFRRLDLDAQSGIERAIQKESTCSAIVPYIEPADNVSLIGFAVDPSTAVVLYSGLATGRSESSSTALVEYVPPKESNTDSMTAIVLYSKKSARQESSSTALMKYVPPKENAIVSYTGIADQPEEFDFQYEMILSPDTFDLDV